MKSIFIKDRNFFALSEPVCAAIGNFDGVHLGHQKLIEEAPSVFVSEKLRKKILNIVKSI